MRSLALTGMATLVVIAGQCGVAAAAQDSGSLDRLAGSLIDRLDTADTVAAIKWTDTLRTGVDPVIDDPAREAAIYDAMAQLGAQENLPAPRVRQVFEGQIEASKIVQRGLVTEWRAGVAAPAPAMDLAAVRTVIDGLNTDIVAELAAEQSDLTGPGCPARITPVFLSAAASHRLDALHTAALLRAVTPLCG
ncbi:chorismate mutase [Nocardia sp. ET3-3]|uniref:Chorismate mutase n=1 Tax=Nocardia terrae TaxID=2675851 RepID=A0A7K1UTQ0_9NOCA|nr:chorismate mutase [Nocardia terrae]MVU77539.1 chorismate mutase [Nocardia terrae]